MNPLVLGKLRADGVRWGSVVVLGRRDHVPSHQKGIKGGKEGTVPWAGAVEGRRAKFHGARGRASLGQEQGTSVPVTRPGVTLGMSYLPPPHSGKLTFPGGFTHVCTRRGLHLCLCPHRTSPVFS